VDPTWIAKAQTAIAGSEYHFVRQADGCLSAPNRAHGLRTLVRPEGIEILPAAETADGFRVTLTLRSWGREGGLLPVGAGTVELDGGRAEIRRRFVTERVVNDLSFIASKRDAGWRRVDVQLSIHEPARRHRAILIFDSDHESRRNVGRAHVVRPLTLQFGTQFVGQPFESKPQTRNVDVERLSAHAVPALADR
jgi:hypothetical protein